MRLLSGRVGVTSYAGLSTHRKQTPGLPAFLGLEEAEPNLGLPANNNFVLYGTTEGERYWAAPSGAPSGSVEGIDCLLYTSPSPRDTALSRMPSSA